MELTDELKVLVEAEVSKALQEFDRLNKKVDEGKKKTASLGEALDKLSGPSTVLAGALAGAGVAAIKFADDLLERVETDVKSISDKVRQGRESLRQ